jgi:membrane protein implicated in regulation of membrane protease activity
MCIRFLFAKPSYIWIGSVLMSLALAFMNLMLLLAIASPETTAQVSAYAFQLSWMALIPTAIWLFCLTLFHLRTNRIWRREREKKQQDFEKKYVEHYTKAATVQKKEGQVRAKHLPAADLSDEKL